MSRHRHVRQKCYSEDYDDDDDDLYGRSLEEETSYSPDEESFIYDRSRNQTHLSPFLENIDLNHSQNKFQENDFEPTNSRKTNQNIPSVKVVRPSNIVTQGFAVENENSEKTEVQFSKSGPSVSVVNGPGKKNINLESNSKRNSAPSSKHNSSPSVKRNSSPSVKRNLSPCVKQNQLKVNGKSNTNRYSPTRQLTSLSCEKKSESLTKQSEAKVKESTCEKNAPPSEFNVESGKENLNLVVVGHVDAGKSTLMGHLLFNLGCVSKKVMQKYEHETEKVGKQSFLYAWILDEIEEERGRGITMDVGKSKFETSNKSITLLDAPGHKDFIPNMITGATQADAALLVIDATAGEFETGFESGGQTREHTLLIRSLGVNQLVVVVNKMDNVAWSQRRFDEICSKLGLFLRQVGFKEGDLSYIPCSGLMGSNLTQKPEDSSARWYKGPTLIEAIDKFHPPERPVSKPLRMCVHDIYKNVGSYCVSGRIETGHLSVGNKVSVQPKGEIAVIKSINVDDESRNIAFAGTYVNVVLSNVDVENICVGHVLCDVQNLIPVASKFEAKIVIFDIVYPITKGYPIMLHLLSFADPVIITKLNSLVHKVTGELIKKNPRCLMKNTAAIVTIETSRPICLELYKDIREFGRFMLRDSGVTVAAGLIIKIL